MAPDARLTPFNPQHLMSPLRLVVVAIPLIAVAGLLGCDKTSRTGQQQTIASATDAAASIAAQEQLALKNALAAASKAFESGDHESAAQALYALLIQFPDDPQIQWQTAQVEAARDNVQAAIEIAQSIRADAGPWPSSVDLRVQLLTQSGQYSRAADLMLQAVEVKRDLPKWRHEAWRLLNVTGRRDEACDQALALCRLGLATEQELLSLIDRKHAFPFAADETDPQSAAARFASGLGKARYSFSRGELNRALDELDLQSRDGFESAAAEAFYGRLLAESQRWESFKQWYAQVSTPAQQFSDYWSALGTFFIDNRSHSAAASCLLEAITRDPTDRVCYQRMSKVLSALGRTADSDQFRHRGVEVAQTERLAKELGEAPTNKESREQLARYLMDLGRPFETLAWTTTMLPVSALGPRQIVSAQRAELLQDPSVAEMTTEISLIGLQPSDFDLQSGIKEWFGQVDTKPVAGLSSAARPITAAPHLVNRASQMGLEFQWYKDVEMDLTSIPIHESLGGGIAVLDYDLNGWPDVYLAQGSGDPPTDQCTRSNQLFRHETSVFADRTDASQSTDFNYSSGLAAGDVNQDGFPDLFLGSLGHNRLLINNGDGTFRDQSAELGTFPDRFTASVAIADINGDRLPDLFESNYIEMEGGFALPKVGPDGKLISPTPLSHFPDSDRWFMNSADGTFQIHEITRTIANPGTSLGIVITDFESDGKNEVFVGIDVRPNHLLVQNGENSFVNVADVNGLANGFDGVANGCMGIATGDFNRDGRLDFQIANYSLEPANLFLQNESGDFTDYSVRFGLAAITHPYVGFGTKAVDFDRNGFLDFIVTNGHIFDLRDEGEPYQMEPQVLMSDGRSLVLTNVEDESGYFDQTYLGRTIAMLDYDHDGATDFLIGHLDQPLALLHDETNAAGSSVQIELVGTASERDAIGAKLVLKVENTEFVEWVTGGDGYFCSDEPVTCFAIPAESLHAEPQNSELQLEIHWPSGLVQKLTGLHPAQRYLVIEGAAEWIAR